MFTLDRSKNDTSIGLDLLRATAAQLVCVGHAISFFVSDWRPSGFALIQNVGVLLFFLISGFLITHTLIRKSADPDYGFFQFCIERFARIYTGLIPALLFVAIVDFVAIYFTSDPTIARYYTLKTFVANLFMLEGYQGVFAGRLRWPAFGSASPLWTLGIEWHIYIFVGALFFMVQRSRSILLLAPIALLFGQTPVFYLFGSFQPDGVGFALFTLWIMGALVYFADVIPVGKLYAGASIGVVAIVAFVAETQAGAEYNLVSYILLAAAFFGLIATTQSMHVVTSKTAIKLISFLADYSFSLYLVHHTLMYAMWTMFSSRGAAMFAIAVVASNLVAIGLAQIGEKHHRLFARLLTRMLGLHAKQSKMATSR
ncbi:MAG TPA: acyltransferase [Bradyrhizobium sp.]